MKEYLIITIKDNILYNDEGESEDISAWVAH